MTEAHAKRQVTVCDYCLRACCWQGVHFCEKYRSAGTTTKPISELRDLNRESSDFWYTMPDATGRLTATDHMALAKIIAELNAELRRKDELIIKIREVVAVHGDADVLVKVSGLLEQALKEPE